MQEFGQASAGMQRLRVRMIAEFLGEGKGARMPLRRSLVNEADPFY